jgi:hypothetical protein
MCPVRTVTYVSGRSLVEKVPAAALFFISLDIPRIIQLQYLRAKFPEIC